MMAKTRVSGALRVVALMAFFSAAVSAAAAVDVSGRFRLAAALLREKGIVGDLEKGIPGAPKSVCEVFRRIRGAECPSRDQCAGLLHDEAARALCGVLRALGPCGAPGRQGVEVVSAREECAPGRAHCEATCVACGVYVGIRVNLDERDHAGDGDVVFASFTGANCRIDVRDASGREGGAMAVVRLLDPEKRLRTAAAIDEALPRLRKAVPDLKFVPDSAGWHVEGGAGLGPAAECAERVSEYGALFADAARASRAGTASAPAKRVRTVIPTPATASFTGEEVETDGFDPKGDLPPYALEAGRAIFSGKTPLSFRYDRSLGPQAYRIAARRDGVDIAAGDEPGAIYAVETLRQLAKALPDGRLSLALGEVHDKPAFAVRGINWNMFVEARGWSMDDGRGVEDFRRRFVAGLDTMAFLKLNAVMVDGLGWNPERFPGYGALMRSLSLEARRRGIRLGYVGYSEGYGAMWLDSDGPKFSNTRDGRKYPCFGLTGSPQRECGTCLSDVGLMEAKKANIRAFVEATEPGFLYVHGADISHRPKMEEAWSNRCEACRARWPSDDTCARDGAAGAFAYLYDELKDAVSSVRNPETGYDAARDLLFMAVAPNYSEYCEDDDEWRYHVDYFRSLSAALRNRDIALMFREQYAGDDGEWRLRGMKKAVGGDVRLAVIEFCAGDGFNNYLPATGEMALTKFFDGCDIVVAAGGNAFTEPRQALWAEYEWNPFGSAYSWERAPSSLRESCRMYQDLSNGLLLPDPVFRDDAGLLSVVCGKLYGEEAGRIVRGFMQPEHVGIPGCNDLVSIIMPLASEHLPGTIFSRFRFLRGEFHRPGREVRWRGDLDSLDMWEVRSELTCARMSLDRTRAAAAGFRRAADACTERRDSLLRMAAACDMGVELGDLTVLWLELLQRMYAYCRGDGRLSEVSGDLRRLESGASRQVLRFEAARRKMIDTSEGWARDGWLSAKYLLLEAENMRATLEKGEYPPHPAPPWW